MAWEVRNGRKYYYKSQRDGHQVRKIYVGKGDLGRTAELEMECRNDRQQVVREWLRSLTEAFAQIDAIDAELALGLAASSFARFGVRMDARAARRIARRQGGSTMEGVTGESSMSAADRETWRALQERASRGDRDAAVDLLPFLDRHPQLEDRLGDLAVTALNCWLDLVAGEDKVAKRATHSKVMSLIASLRQNPADPLERLLAQRVGLLWLQSHYVDVQLAAAMSRTPKEQDLLANRQRTTQEAYATAITSLRDYQRTAGGNTAQKKCRQS